MSVMDTNKDLAYQQTLRNRSKEVRLGLEEGKDMVGRGQCWSKEQELGQEGKGVRVSTQAMVRTLQQAQGQQGHSNGRCEGYSQGSHQIRKACYARIRKWIST